ncbi:hypothetical protein CTKZ_25010 [Cellulomonas algicola]|uniref:4-fold beta flower domain-containing protein n=1 Tax=Cellulomonas algicola TaxID=2071633 RepID=A0A401V210_9CELL|nr:hypothetical protein CTKZ_25010 [Cellulomonas algicola]
MKGTQMDALYGRNGQVVAWLDSDRILDLHGRHMGWIHNEMIVDQGRVRGWFMSGWIRDTSGGAVAFSGEANGFGPVKPVRGVRPVRPVRSVRPVKPVWPVRPTRPTVTSSWSPYSVGQIFVE